MPEEETQEPTCKSPACPASYPVALIERPVTMATAHGKTPRTLFCPICKAEYEVRKKVE